MKTQTPNERKLMHLKRRAKNSRDWIARRELEKMQADRAIELRQLRKTVGSERRAELMRLKNVKIRKTK